jgi:hypothetical protein
VAASAEAHVTFTTFGLISDLNGNPVGYLKTRGICTMSESGSQYSGVTFAEVLDADGNALQSVEVANAGQRVELELPYTEAKKPRHSSPSAMNRSPSRRR